MSLVTCHLSLVTCPLSLVPMSASLPLLFLTALLTTEPTPRGDTVCGPRCVQALLRSYGHEVELIDLVRELHTGGVEQGTTLGQMQDAFTHRGLHAAVVHLPAGASLTWLEPAIVHLKPRPKQALGHFIVYLGEENGTATIHDPLTGTLHGPREELQQKMSGDLLLISKAPISPTSEFAASTRIPWQPISITLGVLGALVALRQFGQSLLWSRKRCVESV